MTRGPLLRLLRDQRGATAPIMALAAAMLIGTAGVALDAGLYFTTDRNLRSVTEAAALAAAVDPANATTRAQNFLVRNGYPASALLSAEVGRYCADKDMAASARFVPVNGACPGNGQRTAVRLKTQADSPLYLTAAFGAGSLVPPLRSSATAARIDEAGLEMTTGVIGLQPGLVNSLLSLLAGKNIALSQSQLDALLASNIDAGMMFDALAARVGETGSYGALVKRTVSLSDLLTACGTSLGSGGGNSIAIGALQIIAGQIGSSVQVPLSGLFDLGVWEKMPVDPSGPGTSGKTGLRAGINSYQLLTYALQSGGREANLGGIQIGLAALASVKLAGMVTSPTNRPRFAFGPQGETTVGTAAVRLLLHIKLVDLLGLGPVLDLPLLLQVGEGTASVTGITCGEEAATDTRVTVDTQSGLLDVFLGKMPTDVLSPTRMPVKSTDISAVDLVLGIVKLRAVAGQVTAASKTLTFVQPGGTGGDGVIGRPPNGGTAATIGNKAALSNTIRNLSIEPTVCILVCLTLGPLVSSVTSLVAAPITALAVDPLLDNLLGALGIQLGYATVWSTGARCGVPVLV